jgi:7-carboxy-7-deazaguanine synthase
LEVRLVEIFSSIQGEGPTVGASTLFVRLGGCDLRCRWCDSAHTWTAPSHSRIERARGVGESEERPGTLPVDEVLDACRALDAAGHRYVSLTGGEPLLQPEACAALARGLQAHGARVLLETHGLHADALSSVVGALDVVSMDWKLASDVWRESDPAGEPPASYDDAHARFLAIAKRVPLVSVKLVVTPNSTDEELERAFRRVAETHPDACLVIQPVTPCGAVKERPSAQRLLELERRASAFLGDVRVMPQTHPILGAP